MISTATLEKREHHHTFLSGKLAAFSLFDSRLSDEERQAIANKVLSLLEQRKPSKMLIDTMTVPHPNFCTSDTFWPAAGSAQHCNLHLQQICPALGGQIHCLTYT